MVASTDHGLTIGRASDNDLVVAHPSVSAHHAELHFDGELFLLRDLSSSNGTFVNGERITSATLEDGDTVHVGPVALEFANGQLQLKVELEPDDQTPDTRSGRNPILVAAVVLTIGLAVAVPLMLQRSDDTTQTEALPPVPTTTVAPPTTVPPATTASPTTVPPATTASPTTTVAPTTTLTPTTTTESPAEIAHLAILTDTYQWGYSGKTGRLQAILAITADGYYGHGTMTAHKAALTGRDLSTAGVPSPPPTTTAAPTTTTATTTTRAPSPGGPDWEELAHSVVQIWVDSCGGIGWTSGSGTVVLDGGYVLTNAHVVADDYDNFCEMSVFAASSASEIPEWIANARVIPEAYDPVVDLAVIRLVDLSGNPTRATGRKPIEVTSRDLRFGNEIRVLGYPALGGETITMSGGEISGWLPRSGGDYYKSSARTGPGVSGGAAFDAITGEYVGTPTAGSNDDVGESHVLIRPSNYALPLLQAAQRAG